MSYKRVLPRDLFNEAKLLKHLGKIALLVHDNMIKGLNIDLNDEANGFKINQCEDGSINVSNLYFYDNKGRPVYFSYPLNCKENNHLIMEYRGEEYYPFNSDGKYQLDVNLFLP